eukprot:c4999_g1_i1.p1 GENE.c4999_g1_i1~~c4999_g1_i1.p1  ORF type:complete len:174 (+),score=68.15 c4999_g1_i1:48-569(+)
MPPKSATLTSTSATTTTKPTSTPSTTSTGSRVRSESFARRIPILGTWLRFFHRIRRTRVYPPNFRNQDDAFQRLTRVKLPLKTALLSFFLLLFGVIFCPLGVYWYLTSDDKPERDRGMAFLILGSIAFLPGIYQFGMIFLAYMGVPGFTYEDLATFDDEWDLVDSDEEDEDDL